MRSGETNRGGQNDGDHGGGVEAGGGGVSATAPCTTEPIDVGNILALAAINAATRDAIRRVIAATSGIGFIDLYHAVRDTPHGQRTEYSVAAALAGLVKHGEVRRERRGAAWVYVGAERTETSDMTAYLTHSTHTDIQP